MGWPREIVPPRPTNVDIALLQAEVRIAHGCGLLGWQYDSAKSRADRVRVHIWLETRCR